MNTEQHVPEHLSVTPEEIQTIESFLDSIKVPYNKEISLPLRQYLQELVVELLQSDPGARITTAGLVRRA